jgi:sugar porter (SP) family MFS transporter
VGADLNRTSSIKNPSQAFVYLVSLIAAAGSFTWSYEIILMSGSILYLKNYFNIGRMNVAILSHSISPSWVEGLTMTTGFWGTVVGILCGSYLADKLGRKRSLILAAMLLLLGTIGTVVSDALVVWNLFRLLEGVGGGLAVLVAPMYVSEIAPAEKRGSFVTFNQMAVVLGAFAANLSTFVIARSLGSNPECWRWMFLSGCAPVSIFLLGLFFIPDTPRWLLMKGRQEEAHRVLSRIGGGEYAGQMLREILHSPETQMGKVRDLFRPRIRIATLIAVGLGVFDQWVGVPTLILYAPSLFVKAGVSSNANAIASTVVLRIGDIFAALFVIYWVDKFGRRPLLLIGVFGTAVAELLMGLCFYHSLSPTVILITFLLCEVTYNASLPPVAWLVTTEIFPTQLRARGMAIHGSIRYCSSLLLAQIFPPLAEFVRVHFGSEGGVFWLFAIICCVTFGFCFLLVPETKGKTLEQISAGYRTSP